MHVSSTAARAYQASAGNRSPREQEAELFQRVNYAMRSAQAAGPIQRVRALADNRLLWNTVIDLVRDPQNKLPTPLRAGLISIGHTVQREMDRDDPDMTFLLGINEQIAAGLTAS